jgi:predicted DNA-binding transcriptional regulator YafY
MYHPTTRVLAVLEMLQTNNRLSGAEIAGRLEVDIRTARRYITMLQDLGIPIVAERGRYGAYSLEPGFKLPPMMFTNDDALALALGLLAARQLGLAEAAPAVESAQAKLERVIPLDLKERVRALMETVVLDLQQPDVAPAGQVMLAISEAARERRRLHMHYRSSQADDTERDFDPYGLAFRGGRWYVVGHCHLRGGMRLFRIDRVQSVDKLEMSFQPPKNFDILQQISESIASVPRQYPVAVLLETTLDIAQREIPADAFLLEQVVDGVQLRGRTDDLGWMAHLLSRLTFPFVILEPPDLQHAVETHATALLQMARRHV